ncbi:hypothetical protein ACFYS8_03140 [Kitasatospora sp. NPDC004615]|uniref:DUF7683 domain-containing protein n=1 Tax=Kitasatospora sp. NPDC004615 TaxID=3364017 RepID=UPI0036CAA65F
MIWVVLGFDRSDDELVVERTLPASFDEASAANLVGPWPDLIGSSFPLSDDQLPVIEELIGVKADGAKVSYFLEAQQGSH